MNLRFYIICIAAVLAFAVPALADSTATVHGTVYTWDTFEPLENAVVEVNSTPSQSMVANLSFYSFKLEPGTYNITAKYYQNGTLLYSAQKTTEIKGPGDYRLDLLLFPVYSSDLMDNSKTNGSTGNLAANSQASLNGGNNSNTIGVAGKNKAGIPALSYIVIAFALFSLFAGGYSLSTKRKRNDEKAQYQASPTPKTKENSRLEHKSGTSSEVVISSESEKIPKPPAVTFELNNQPEIEPELGVKTDLKKDSEETVYRDNFEIGLRAESEPESDSKERVIKPAAIVLEESLNSEIKQTTEPESGIQGSEKKIERGVQAEKLEAQPANLTKPLGSEPEKRLDSGKDEEIEYKIKEPGSDDSGIEEKEQMGSLENTLHEPPLSTSEIEPMAPRKKAPLPSDLQEVMDIIRGQGGRITQKNLRSKLKYSEGKVSLMLADLERRELIEKFKRGRGNIVIIKDEER